jgi:tetratricopeptide (TPR) repeat protein
MADDRSQLLQRATAAYRLGRWEEVDRHCRAMLDDDARDFDALHLVGLAAASRGRMQEALDLVSRAISANPMNAGAHFSLGNVLRAAGRHADALQCYERALQLDPDFVDAYNNRGNALAHLKRYAEAVASYDRAIAIRPANAGAYFNRAIALGNLKRHAEAVESYGLAIAHKPDFAAAYNNRGISLGELQRHDEALESYDRALGLNPGYAEAHGNRGTALMELQRFPDAVQSYERALLLNPGYANAHYNLGNALRELHRHAEAVESYRRSIALKPDFADAHLNLANCLLALGDFETGWDEFEWRWRTEAKAAEKRDYAQPRWLGGQDLGGKTLLLHHEQGLGDTLQFCRYAKLAAARGAKVVLEVQPSLLPLLADLEGAAQVLPAGAPLPAFDYYCPLMSLPGAFRTDLSSVPAAIPYLRSDPLRVALWAKKLGTRSRPRIGLVWSGSRTRRHERRSIGLEEMLPLIGDWAEWISLQKEVRRIDAAILGERPDLRHFGAELNDFADTAALVEAMDLVVTVDTSVAHVAGAMGKAVWVLLPFNPVGWNWMLTREDSPWYPTARLFRQPAHGDWASVIRRVDAALRQRFGVGN